MILFRADGNAQIGSGHVMRCLSIAREAAKNDEVLFVTADNSFHEIISEAGIENYCLNSVYSDVNSEIEKMKIIINKFNPDFLFVDSYYVTERYLNILKKYCNERRGRLIYIDDVLAFAYPCDVLVNYNIYAPNKEGDYNTLYTNVGLEVPKLLLGTSYTPLRPEFQDIPDRKVNEEVKNVLVSTGGADSEHIALQIVKEIMRRKLIFSFHIIIGTMNTDTMEIEKIVGNASNITLHLNVKDMSSLMRKCDIAVSAAGSTLYELCATQTPIITYILAENQRLGAEKFERQGLLKYVGDYRKDKKLISKIINNICILALDYKSRVKNSIKMRKIIKGNGCSNILNKIREFPKETV